MDLPIRELRELLNRVDDPRAMTPGDLAYFLGIFREISNSLFKTLRDDPAFGLSDDVMRKVDKIFAELSDNFFPMSHSNKPLVELQIIERESIAKAVDFLRITEDPVLGELRDRISQIEQHARDVRRDLERYP
jgi:hypothetical protein